MKSTNSTARPSLPNVLTFSLFLSLLLTVVLTGCSNMSLPDRMAAGNAWQATCPPGKHLVVDGRFDASATALHTAVDGDLKQIVRDSAARVAICGGRLSIRAFAGSSAGTAVLFDQPLSLPQATANARYLASYRVQDDVVDAVSHNYKQIAGLRGGSDIVGQFANSYQLLDQLGPDYHLSSVTVTDGMQNIGGVDPAQADDDAAAQQLVAQVDVPRLSGADVTIVGLGNVNGVKESTAVTANLVRFYRALCSAMDAATCTIATDYASPVGSDR